MISDFCSAFRAIDLLQGPLRAPIPFSTLSVEGGYSTRTFGAAPRFPRPRAPVAAPFPARCSRHSPEQHPAGGKPAFRQHLADPDEPHSPVDEPHEIGRASCRELVR